MRWSNVILILQREIRDQLRDRRTLFMIAVLPLLLYPLLGMTFFQISQFMREKSVRVLVLGATDFGELPPLVENNRFAADLFSEPRRAELLQLEFRALTAPGQLLPQDPAAAARQAVRDGDYDVALYFPPDFNQRLERFRTALVNRASPEMEPPAAEIPSPEVIYNAAKEASELGFARVSDVIHRWTDAVGRQNLRDSRLPVTAAHPFSVTASDVAGAELRQAAVWAKILPFVVLLWALTGAFYPAVDLCAGEKERGTLETLLSSPAERIEIVWGKLLCIMLFSMATAVLNLLSMGLTGSLVMQHLPNMAPPPLGALGWLLLALVPMAALFSALCLALAAFARSSKEGQYYLMPLVLVTMPLTVLPMSPGVELNFGNSLIPVTGVVLLLRNLLEGEVVLALAYLPIVASVTLGCCWLAIRWATEQFNSESVLFRESERLDVGLWIRQLVRDRQATPTLSEAVACGVIILVIRFFLGLSLQQPHTFADLALLAVVTQFVVILTPAMLMTAVLTRSPLQTLRLRLPRLWTLPAAVLLALAMHPVSAVLQAAVMRLYPIDQRAVAEFSQLLVNSNLWTALAVMAVVPAVCEELAFRGFILSGLYNCWSKRRAIVVSAVFFGMSHAFFQQSLLASFMGLLLGYLALQTGSLWPCILFHVTHNGLALAASRLTAEHLGDYPLLGRLFQSVEDGQLIFRWPVVALSGLVAVGVLLGLRRLSQPAPDPAHGEVLTALERQPARQSLA